MPGKRIGYIREEDMKKANDPSLQTKALNCIDTILKHFDEKEAQMILAIMLHSKGIDVRDSKDWKKRKV